MKSDSPIPLVFVHAVQQLLVCNLSIALSNPTPRSIPKLPLACALRLLVLIFVFQACLYRKIFEEFFPTPAAAETVPMGKSIACSTARALEWDESFKVCRSECSRLCGGRRNCCFWGMERMGVAHHCNHTVSRARATC